MSVRACECLQRGPLTLEFQLLARYVRRFRSQAQQGRAAYGSMPVGRGECVADESAHDEPPQSLAGRTSLRASSTLLRSRVARILQLHGEPSKRGALHASTPSGGSPSGSARANRTLAPTPSHLPPRARSPSLSSVPALPGGKERLGCVKPAKAKVEAKREATCCVILYSSTAEPGGRPKVAEFPRSEPDA